MISDAETVTVTATNRLARHLQLEHARRMTDAGREAWETPAILSWRAWLASLFDEVTMTGEPDVPLLLSGAQARALWRDILRRSEAGSGLMRPERTVERVARAWDQLRDHGLSADDVRPDGSPDVAAFRAWAETFARRLADRGWLDPAGLAPWLAERLPGYDGPLPVRVVLAGFDELTPARAGLARALEAAGVEVETTDFPDRGERVVRLDCADAAEEVTAAARQARAWLAADPAARIGIVAPVLASRRAALARELEAALVPAARAEPAPPAEPPFNLSLGPPLKSAGLVADALAALGLMRGWLDWESAGRLLRSPYLAGARAERGARAAMDADLRSRGERRWSLALLERAAEACGATRWRTAMQRCRVLMDEGPSRATPGDWSRRVGEWLEALGWCRGDTLGSRDYQAQQAWFDLLRSFAELGTVSGPMDAAGARRTLAEMAGETPFQPQSGAAPVQVMGLLETAGLEFDHLWIMGLSDDAWPRPPSPNPFLPLSLQREHDMPHADARRELAFAEGVMGRLLGSAPDVVLSWPRREGDADLAPSPLLPVAAPGERADAGDGPWAAWRRGDLALYGPDRLPPAVAPGPVRGGSGLLTDQAACPFRALAARRLDADPLEQPAVALDARARGSLVHEALRALWDDLRGSERLAALDGEAIAGRVARAVAAARNALEGRLPPQPESFWALEERRLARLLTGWLAMEAGREPFEAVAREEAGSLTLAGLELSLQVDRRDRLADGRELIVDYKTGATGHSPKAWLSERPDQPQLPSYALALAGSGTLGGLAFAHVHPRKRSFSGVTEIDGELRRYPKGQRWGERPEGCRNLVDLTRYWQQRLEGLAAGFREGVSHTDPHHPRVCDHCHRQVLCRVREGRPYWDEDGEDADV